jgi:hypothetical protein
LVHYKIEFTALHNVHWLVQKLKLNLKPVNFY